MSDMPLEIMEADFEPPTDPLTVAYEDFQESDRYEAALVAVRETKVDDVDAGPFLKRDISLQEVVGQDAATDVAAEGIIHGFEAGFDYGTRGALGAFRKRLIEDQMERYGIVLPDAQEIVDQLEEVAQNGW